MHRDVSKKIHKSIAQNNKNQIIKYFERTKNFKNKTKITYLLLRSMTMLSNFVWTFLSPSKPGV